ncbi:MAG: hypothetical protein QM773_20020 [Hyphomonadaceae bacterium]
MVKEIGNWGKLAKRKQAETSAPFEQSAAALIASKLDPDEELLWASYGSGTRPWSDRIYRNAGRSLLVILVAAAILPVALASTPLAAPVESLRWVLLLLPVYTGYRTYAGPQFEAYAVTDTRAVVLQRDLPFILRTCEILALRVEEGPAGTGAVRFGRIADAPSPTAPGPGPFVRLFNDTTPEAGFYGIARPHEVARLIQTRLLDAEDDSAFTESADDEMLPATPQPETGDTDG